MMDELKITLPLPEINRRSLTLALMGDGNGIPLDEESKNAVVARLTTTDGEVAEFRMDELTWRTFNACEQLQRYSFQVFNLELADVLDAITDINDDMHHTRARILIHEQIERAKALLDHLEASLPDDWV